MRMLSRNRLRRMMGRVFAGIVAELTTDFLGGSGDLGDGTNWDNGVPTSSDDAVISGVPTTGSVTCRNLTGSQTLPSGTSFTISGTCTITWGGATCSGTLNSVGCSINNDPGCAINSSATTLFGCSIAGAITDDGSGNFAVGSGGWTFGTVSFAGAWGFNATVATLTANSVSNGTITNATISGAISGGTFSGTVTAGSISGATFSAATVTCSNVTGGTFSGGSLTQGGANVNNDGASFGGTTVVWTGVVFPLGNVACTACSASTVSGVGGSSSNVSYTIPTADQIIVAGGGNYVVTPTNKVLAGTAFGPSGSLTGTASSGGLLVSTGMDGGMRG